MRYLDATEQERDAMLHTIGVASLEQLFADIPAALRLQQPLALPAPLSEQELLHEVRQTVCPDRCSLDFSGAGAYRHDIPAAVDALTSRSEFYTAYTPYQPEVSQGTLAAIFEFQTLLCRLTGMQVANASMYDGATALAEAVLMSLGMQRKRVVAVCAGLHPHYRQVLETYCWAAGYEVCAIAQQGGVTPAALLPEALHDQVGAVVVQNPNFYGCLEDVAALAHRAHAGGAHLVVTVAEPISLGLLQAPGGQGADILCGEGQALGNPVGFGGPMLGLLAAQQPFMRKMPGRLVGQTLDAHGAQAFVLTLQAREQHIRREKATSNICTNEGLCALRAVIYLALSGNRLRDLALLNHRLAGRLRRGLRQVGWEPLFDRPYFNEFAVRVPNARMVQQRLQTFGFDPGVCLGDYDPDLEDALLLCCTEMHTAEDIDRLVAAAGSCV